MEAEKASSSKGKKSGLLKNQLSLVKRRTSDGKDRYEIAPVEETLSFEKGFFLFIRAVQLLSQKNDGVILVGLAGPSGAGKTVFSEKVASFLPGVVTISMDNYNDSSRVIDGNFDDPRLTDYDTLLNNIEGLRQGQEVNVPIYDFKKSSRVGYRKVQVPTSRIVIIEGIYALSEKLRPLLDMRVSVTGGVHFDLVKRVLRDIDRSAQDPEDIIQQISETVYPMYKAFIEPDLKTAHIKIVNKFNPFSGFQNAAYILKSAIPVSEEAIQAVLGPNTKKSTEETYDIYLLPPGEDRETCQSYLRMRNRDGRYSLMFEEWVTDGPFIISPRITFEVSVRLLGGLMALGYEMASILKRTSHVFCGENPNISIKIDKLEQLERTYVQVQGKERTIVQETARKLGMEGHYLPRSYIEQIQLEKLTQEVMTLPEELKERLTGNLEDMAAFAPRSLPAYRGLEQAMLPSRSAKLNRSSSVISGRIIQENGHSDPGTLKNPGSSSNLSENPPGVQNGDALLKSISMKLDECLLRLARLEGRALPDKRFPPPVNAPTPILGFNRTGSSSELSSMINNSQTFSGGSVVNGNGEAPVPAYVETLLRSQSQLTSRIESLERSLGEKTMRDTMNVTKGDSSVLETWQVLALTGVGIGVGVGLSLSIVALKFSQSRH